MARGTRKGSGRREAPGLIRAGALMVALALAGSVGGCDSSGSPTGPAADDRDGGPGAGPNDPGPSSDPPARFPGFDLDLAVGDFWEFYWASESLTVSSGSTSSSTAQGRFRLTLTDRVTVAGVTAFAVEVTGDDLDRAPLPAWQYLATDGSVLLGSTTGDSLEVVLDAGTGSWAGGGFFARFDPDTPVEASEVSVDTAYVATDRALLARVRQGQDFCQIIAGVRVCTNDEAYSISVSEYFKAGIGPLALATETRTVNQGGGFTTSTEYRLEIGLVATSRRAPDGFRPTPPPWRERADMPRAVSDAVTVSFGGLIYLFGGLNPETGELVRSSLVYDPASDAWSEGPELAYQVAGQGFVVGDAIYFPNSDFGDRILSFHATPAGGEWRVSAPYPFGISGASPAGVIDGRILFIDRRNITPRQVALYDPATDLWELGTNANQPYLRTQTAWTSDGTRFYTSGGFSSRTFRSQWSAYTITRPLTDRMTWPADGVSLAEGRARHRMAALGGWVLALGGDNFGPVLRSVEAWNPDAGVHVQASPMLEARQSFMTAVHEGELYVFGGQGDRGTLRSVESYAPDRDRRLAR